MALLKFTVEIPYDYVSYFTMDQTLLIFKLFFSCFVHLCPRLASNEHHIVLSATSLWPQVSLKRPPKSCSEKGPQLMSHLRWWFIKPIIFNMKHRAVSCQILAINMAREDLGSSSVDDWKPTKPNSTYWSKYFTPELDTSHPRSPGAFELVVCLPSAQLIHQLKAKPSPQCSCSQP